jgi:hypothetical protein
MTTKLRIIPLMDGPDAATTVVTSDEFTPDLFVQLLDQRKAVILQKVVCDEPIDPSSGSYFDTEDFGSILTSLNLEYYPYFGGAAPRVVIPVSADERPIVFTANER